MSKCRKCGAHLRPVPLARYPADTVVGLPGIAVLYAAILMDCPTEGCEGGTYVYVPDVPELEAALAIARIMIPVKLTGDEVRFLRNTVRLKAKEIAELVQVTPETVSRWEHGKEQVGAPYEKILRLAIGFALTDRAPGVRFAPHEILTMHHEPLSGRLAFFCTRTPVLVRQGDKLEERTCWKPAREELATVVAPSRPEERDDERACAAAPMAARGLETTGYL